MELGPEVKKHQYHRAARDWGRGRVRYHMEVRKDFEDEKREHLCAKVRKERYKRSRKGAGLRK